MTDTAVVYRPDDMPGMVADDPTRDGISVGVECPFESLGDYLESSCSTSVRPGPAAAAAAQCHAFLAPHTGEVSDHHHAGPGQEAD